MKSYYRKISFGSPQEEKLEPIILLHGLLLSGKCLQNVAPLICTKTKRKIYIPDARNHGQSPWTDDMNYDLLVEDLRDFMDEQNINKAILVGNSMGGRTAMYFALKFPHRVEALIVEDMTPRNVASGAGKIMRKTLDMYNTMLKKIPPEMDIIEVKNILLKKMTNIFGTRFMDKEKFLKILDMDAVPVIKDGNSFRLECNIDAVTKMLNENALVQNLPSRSMVYEGDALFIYGSKPFFNLEKDPTIKKLFPKAIVKKVQGSSHFIHQDAPEKYAGIISDFILNRDVPASKY